AANFAMTDYPEYTKARFKLKDLPDTPTELLEAIGRKRGALRPGGVIDMHKASEVLLHELRGGKLGRITFETVCEWEEKIRLAEIARLEAEAAEQAEAEALRAQQAQQEQ
ncbi:MAG: ribosome biogenesis GTPase YlqF, partial [Pontibacterium sp.]